MIGKGFAIVEQFMNSLQRMHRPDAIYRGHADKTWKTMPSVYRDGAKGITNRLELEQWKDIARRFIARNMTDIEWLVLAQHYGIHTRLLDWTTNPLISLYFACLPQRKEDGFEADGAVLQVFQAELMQESNEIFDPARDWEGQPILIKAHAMNRRSLAQDSIMTLHCEMNRKLSDEHDPVIFTIHGMEKKDVIEALSAFGISNERVYADINTAARDFQERMDAAVW